MGHEDIFIAQLRNADKRPEKYDFDFNHKWGVNNSDTKKSQY
jgi:hypothetical protein